MNATMGPSLLYARDNQGLRAPAATTDREVVEFLQWAMPQLQLEWPGFRRVRNQVRKRVRRRMQELGCADLDLYRRYIEANPLEWSKLDDMCRITVSRFYRNVPVFELVDRTVLPHLAASGRNPVRIWSAGCGGGEEPYTLSILWRAHHAGGPALEIVATDAEPRQLARAASGVYLAGATRDLPLELRRAAFECAGQGKVRLRDAYRAGIELAQQDVRRERPPGSFDLILCRNLAFTYFDHALQVKVGAALVEALHEGGYLVVGRGEGVPAELGLRVVDAALGVYQR